MRPTAGLAASLFLTVLAFAGCAHGTVIGSNPLPTPTPTVPKVTNEFTVPTANSKPGGIVLAPDGYLYFTEQNAGQIGQMTTGGSFKEFGIAANGGTAGNNPVDITSGSDGNLWFTEQGASPGIGMMALVGEAVTEHPIAGSSPTFITRGPIANTLVFSDPGNNAIGQITTSGAVTETPIPTANADPLGLAVNSGDVNHVYFVENSASKIGILNVQTHAITEVPTLTPNAGPMTIVQGPDGAMWFTENNAAKIGRISTSGVMTEYPLAPAASAAGLIAASDNNLYFGDVAQNEIGRISAIAPATITEYAIPTASASPGQFAFGVDGLLYFTETNGNKIARMIY